jgi:hypothetical protein
MTKTPAQLNRDIAESLSRPLGASGGKQPLYGHTSEATAYVVDDYPYGYTARTQIRYWLEGPKANKGWRFVSQTKNPKSGSWNKSKASTYMDWGAAMFLDEKGHVAWDGIGAYSDASKILAFVQTFPGADMSVLKKVVPAKQRVLADLISGKRFFTINGVKQERSAADNERDRRELEVWEQIGAAL